MQDRTREVLLDALAFPECPRWHDGRLWVSDMYAGVVLAVDMEGRAERILEVPGSPAGLGFLPGGDMLVVSGRGRRLLRARADGISEVADLAALTAGECNDMVVDDRGRAYVGHFGFDLLGGEPMVPAGIVLVEPDGATRTVAEDLMFPNGTVLTSDGMTLIVAETFAARLSAFDVAPDGSLSNRRVFAELPGSMPDGICLDAEGCVWVASFSGSEFLRVTEGGEVRDRVATPGRTALACMLGGDDGATLYLCTAETTVEQMARRESKGFIETVRVDIPHAGRP